MPNIIISNIFVNIYIVLYTYKCPQINGSPIKRSAKNSVNSCLTSIIMLYWLYLSIIVKHIFIWSQSQVFTNQNLQTRIAFKKTMQQVDISINVDKNKWECNKMIKIDWSVNEVDVWNKVRSKLNSKGLQRLMMQRWKHSRSY